MIESVSGVLALMKSHGANRFYAKKLAPNDNSKNQIYLGGDFSALNVIPHGSIYADADEKASSKRDRAKADVDLYWVDEHGCYRAPGAQLILYPKYPEVRMSGFLKGCRNAPGKVLRVRDEGRVLVLGMTEDKRVLGFAAGKGHPVAMEVLALPDAPMLGVFIELSDAATGEDTRTVLLAKLAAIHQKLWIPSQRLNRGGALQPYIASNAGGYTLEAELGISPNGYSEPDFLGWEIKQYGVRDFEKFLPRSPVTLMTPEPTGGIYHDQGVDVFLRRFGYPDKNGKPDRLNFGGIYDCTKDFHPDTGLKLELQGYDSIKRKITDIDGCIALVSRDGEVAALWKFTEFMEHWNRKHAQAAYVPSLSHSPPPSYRYGPRVLLCEEADFGLLLEAMTAGAVFYDPAIKMESASSSKPKIKRRSQFRVRHESLERLYQRTGHFQLQPDTMVWTKE
ncbi:MvaI/BcnI family restriction endonuclease [Dyella silvae]|uniref:MvaI/BcnI family restriction endonuclease n=1 Tax=Dyella silvae TaxID=2994424 RepID=UPI002263B5EA|nr:MvaI/BcnI family restriction endonuclease [Dyella silvae]